MYTTRLLMEAGCVGAVLAFALTLGQHVFVPSTTSETLLYGFVLGVFIHFGFELAGMNTYYCLHGAMARLMMNAPPRPNE